MSVKATITFVMDDVDFDGEDDMIMVANDAIFENGLSYYTENDDYEITDVQPVEEV